MPLFERAGTTISYDVHGDGYPLLLIAPGGMYSVAQMWGERPGSPGEPMPWIDPRAALADRFTVISMDQRNAGGSTGPIEAGDGWHTFTGDQLALLDHLGLEKVHVMGGCIGSSYVLSLCQAAPGRVSAAVLQNPIGLSADNRPLFMGMFDGWGAAMLAKRSDVTAEALAEFRDRMFGGEFVFSVSRDFVSGCTVPFLVLAGDDEFHPHAVAEEIVGLAPDAELIVGWAGHQAETEPKVRAFLTAHTPAGWATSGSR